MVRCCAVASAWVALSCSTATGFVPLPSSSMTCRCTPRQPHRSLVLPAAGALRAGQSDGGSRGGPGRPRRSGGNGERQRGSFGDSRPRPARGGYATGNGGMRRRRPDSTRPSTDEPKEFLDDDFDLDELMDEVTQDAQRERDSRRQPPDDRRRSPPRAEASSRGDDTGRRGSRHAEEQDEGRMGGQDEGELEDLFEESELPPIEYREDSFMDGKPDVQRLLDQFFFSKKTFAELGASPQALQALDSLGVSRPSKIQTIVYPHVLEGKSCVIAEQTGSGKTLAYLLPLLQRLKEMETSGLGKAPPRCPRLIILAPTAELASQVTSVARSLTRHMQLRVSCVTGGKSPKTQREMLDAGVDVLIGTPGRLQWCLQEKMVELGEVKAIVLDEVDVMFLDETFDLTAIGSSAPAGTQFLFVTATLPAPVAAQISSEFPGIKKLWGPGLHKIAPQVEEVLVDCSGPADEEKREDTAFLRKRDMLVQNLVKHSVPRTLVFCNTIPNCRKVENALKRADRKGDKWRVLVYHSAVADGDRKKNLDLFSRPNPRTPMAMVCTDRTSRGVDFDSQDVEHVVLFDFPRDPSEYVRRVGRTGRAGRLGRVTALVLGKQVALARSIMEGNKRGQRVHPIPQ